MEVRLYARVRKRFSFTLNVDSFLQKENWVISNNCLFTVVLKLENELEKILEKLLKKNFFRHPHFRKQDYIFWGLRHAGVNKYEARLTGSE